jgi:hypothetical protein
MKLLIIFGPPAVGKMTVGQEISNKTDFKLFHNHLTIEPLLNIFEYESKEFQRLNKIFRTSVFEEAAKSDLKGFIFTFVWALEQEKEFEYLKGLIAPFKEQNAEVFFLELESDLNVRLERNKTENRLIHKPSKKDIQASEKRLLNANDKYILNSDKEHGCPIQENYFKLNNSHLEPGEVAELVISNFKF